MNEYQSVLNALMISELRKLKEEQSKLNEAVLSLKLDSLKLESKVDNQFHGVRTQNSYLLTSNIISKNEIHIQMVKNQWLFLI